MPIYEYICDNCSNRFERMQRFNDDPIQVCPNCSSNGVRRLISPAGIIFKGSGWYITDSRQLKSGAVAGLPAPKGTKSAASSDAPPSSDGSGE